jgi:hypothetical protein
MTQKGLDLPLSSTKQEMRSVFFFGKHRKDLALDSFPLYPLGMESVTDTPAWITELLAATGRFEALVDHVNEWTEEFCKKDEKEVA